MLRCPASTIPVAIRCAAGCGSVADDDEPADASATADDASRATAPDAAGPADDPDAAPAELDADVVSIEPHCDVESPLGSAICLETVVAEPGAIVDIEVHLIAQDGCTELDQSHADVLYDEDIFTFVSANGDDCLMQDDREDPTRIYWHAFTEAAIGSDVCPESLPPGHVDTIQFEIAPEATADDYTLEVDKPNIQATSDEPNCGGDAGIDGIVRITE